MIRMEGLEVFVEHLLIIHQLGFNAGLQFQKGCWLQPRYCIPLLLTKPLAQFLRDHVEFVDSIFFHQSMIINL